VARTAKVYLVGGGPLVFGRGDNQLEFLSGGAEVVPNLSPAPPAPAFLRGDAA